MKVGSWPPVGDPLPTVGVVRLRLTPIKYIPELTQPGDGQIKSS
jgi:hypothetical protein